MSISEIRFMFFSEHKRQKHIRSCSESGSLYDLKEEKLLNEKHLRSEAGGVESYGREHLIDSMPHKAALWPWRCASEGTQKKYQLSVFTHTNTFTWIQTALKAECQWLCWKMALLFYFRILTVCIFLLLCSNNKTYKHFYWQNSFI